MDSELHATEVKCKDGVTFSVHAPGPRLTIVTAPNTEMTANSAIGPYRREVSPGNGTALYGGMPVEAVRAFCVMHGGVAQIGTTAQDLLQALPTEADLAAAQARPADPPITDSPAEVSLVRSGFEAGTHDFLGRPLPDRLPVDHLTPFVIEARRVVAEVERPLVPGLGHAGASPRQAALEWRAEQAAIAKSNLSIMERAQYARHPLRSEAAALTKRLAKARNGALAEIAREA
ncbi:hypothetical protein MMSR116_15800 [Methylobacterium mesophilicum SR1.6/6]|uniref:Uncharacterized protein n=1 Tax=Methylobacterium mesophilicum SR1.6/6 TaxID=908290 RepID=A0A6B9FPN1_9HYPH|nr:hypothetical protein [Methylobacterium mesophilicum]QGY03184.1 hypothetical protein MMSR116_15800 [Methylobacterium mesophilicum SR1.6/6]